MRNDKLYAAIVDVLREFGEVRHISSIAHELEIAIVSAQSLASPKIAENDPDRAIDCERAVYADVMELISRAVAVGWSEKEATSTIIEIGRSHLISLDGYREAEIEGSLKLDGAD
ncbi:hypothetical protein [Rhizobium sp. NRK18]|uniref:hypothetical protein n=1 Tax=Rhizobium sp. NRK18 TaxID=2964667 RepID=UPI0021C33455|nr:hypothetical protein [Rhizobium sp. NRK18]MCQ2005470.1 hypothetical protein [Rhizobium sp. NRK18]